MTSCDLLLVGSSIFEQWESMGDSLPGRTVINQAVGGTETHDWLERLPAVLDRFCPRILAYYCGSNDIGRGKTVAGVLQRTQTTLERMRERFPIPFLYFSIIKAPEKMARWSDVDEVNHAMASFIQAGNYGQFLDLNGIFFDQHGQCRRELYQEDQLHLTAEAYRAMNQFCGPQIEVLLSTPAG